MFPNIYDKATAYMQSMGSMQLLHLCWSRYSIVGCWV